MLSRIGVKSHQKMMKVAQSNLVQSLAKRNALQLSALKQMSLMQSAVVQANLLDTTSMRNFSRFYKNNSKSSNRQIDFKTYTPESITKDGLDLKNGINDLPEPMIQRLKSKGVNELFPVQTTTFSLFANKENELIVKSRTGTGKTLSFLLPLEYLLKFKGAENGQADKK